MAVTIDDRCDKCGSVLVVDRASQEQLRRHGFLGGRIFCPLGCTDLWVKSRRLAIQRDVRPPDGRGKYDRPERAFVCRRCRQRCQTRGTNTRRCKECQAEIQRERDRQRWERKRCRLASRIA